MKNKYIIKILFLSLLLLTGCEEAVDNEWDNIISVSLEAENEEEDCLAETEEFQDNEIVGEDAMDSEELLDAFLAGEIPAYYDNGADTIWMSEYLSYEFGGLPVYAVGERTDLDNDGENEQIVDGPYGGMYFDARDGKVYLLAEGEGTSGCLSYADYDGATWIVHRDTSHAGRQIYWLTKYDGDGNIADEFILSAEYWESPNGKYDENSDFTYRDEKISMTEYEALRKEIFESNQQIADVTTEEIFSDTESYTHEEIYWEDNETMHPDNPAVNQMEINYELSWKAEDYLIQEVPELEKISVYVEEKSGGKAVLIVDSSIYSVKVYKNGNELMDNYYIVYVGEQWEDHRANWYYFYVSENIDEVLWYDIVECEVYSLEEWRSSSGYKKMIEEIGGIEYMTEQ